MEKPSLPDFLESPDNALDFRPFTLFRLALSNIGNRFRRYLVILFGIILTSCLVIIIRGYTVAIDIVEDIQISTSILFYGTLVTVICFGLVAIAITSTIFLAITERIEEIGLYRICGANSRDVFILFEIESLLIGCLGLLSGSLVGAILFFLDLSRTLTRTTLADFLLTHPVVMTSLVETFFFLVPFIFLVVVVSSLIPVIHAVRMEVNDTIRHHV
ncbi:MAG: FtsX-like permease family protein [Candidatus Heimdallarchaeota archaeon]